ncbi:MAG TPA: phosphotransferase [Streptosporangiaceae bacterium]|nr:phosphotransferase [Streptosporangiaceae bacterium]
MDGAPAAIASRFGADSATAADLRYVSNLRGRLAGHQIARSVVHGDFWPGNILIDDGRVRGVIGWEDSRPEGPAVLDLVRFVMTYSLYLDRHTRPGHRVRGHPGLRADRWGAGIEYALEGSGWYPGLARRFLAEGLEQLGAPGACGRDVLMAGLVTTAAEADHPGFAREHLLLFRRLCTGGER